MGARYVFRMDDITPTMDWNRFWSLLTLFNKRGIKPLLGIVPDNRDPKLKVHEEHPQFWETMRDLYRHGHVDFAQHGYQHILTQRPGAAIIGARYGIKEMSEFAGLSLNDQISRIRLGQTILNDRGIFTSYFMAPNHSYDHNTLIALKRCGFTAVTDGISLYPFRKHDLVFVPQQFWRPVWMPCGVITICLHSDSINNQEVKSLRAFLRRPFTFSSFSEEVGASARRQSPRLLNYSFKMLYLGARQFKKASAAKNKAATPRFPVPQRRKPASGVESKDSVERPMP
jgi:predicted deacetylase